MFCCDLFSPADYRQYGDQLYDDGLCGVFRRRLVRLEGRAYPRGHFISARLSRRGRIALDSIDNILTMIFAALIATQCFSQALFVRQMGLKTLMLEIPRYRLCS
jgi:hypothetical protein